MRWKCFKVRIKSSASFFLCHWGQRLPRSSVARKDEVILLRMNFLDSKTIFIADMTAISLADVIPGTFVFCVFMGL